MSAIIIIIFLLVITRWVQFLQGYNVGDVLPERTCATIFSAENFEGDSFVMTDFDQSVNMRWDYRAFQTGWHNTGSVKVESGCQMFVCTDTYFLGDCQLVTNNVSAITNVIFDVHSANCTCNRKCKCEDVYIGKNEYGRAYLKDDCNKCNSEYISLKEFDDKFPPAERNVVSAFVIRKGCHLTIYSEEYKRKRTTTIRGSIFRGFRASISSYEMSCDDTKFLSRSSLKKQSELTIDLPKTRDRLNRLLLAKNSTPLNHPGLNSALTSAENRKSFKNAYIILFGTPNVQWYAFPHCKDDTDYDIRECSIPVNMDHLGISITQLNIISVWLNEINSDEDYCSKMITLEKYLSAQEDLKDALPTAVIIEHDIRDNNFAKAESHFVRILQALHYLRHRLFDENYSNAIFLLGMLSDLSDAEKRKPDARMLTFMTEIVQQWTFPPPVEILPISREQDTKIHVNGYRKMENQEYWPMNLERSLTNLCEKAGDPLGHAILKAHFQNKGITKGSVISTRVDVVSTNTSKLNQCRDVAKSALSQQPILKELSTTKLLSKTNSKYEQAVEQLQTGMSEEKMRRLSSIENINITLDALQMQIKKLKTELVEEKKLKLKDLKNINDVNAELRVENENLKIELAAEQSAAKETFAAELEKVRTECAAQSENIKMEILTELEQGKKAELNLLEELKREVSAEWEEVKRSMLEGVGKFKLKVQAEIAENRKATLNDLEMLGVENSANMAQMKRNIYENVEISRLEILAELAKEKAARLKESEHFKKDTWSKLKEDLALLFY